MLTLVLVTAAVLGVTLVVGLVAALVFLVKIRRFATDTHAALVVVAERGGGLAGRLDGVRDGTEAAASEFAAMRT